MVTRATAAAAELADDELGDGERLGATGLRVLPNPSGLNANYQLRELIRLFGELRVAASP
jgi:hypothetical protein